MEHFSQQDWIDFVRDALAPGRKGIVEAHLADGCPACRATASGWQTIVNLAARSRKPEPPDEAVNSVKAAYRVAQAPRRQLDLVQFATLVFDSFLMPAPAGVRAASSEMRQWAYQAGTCTVEFQLGAGFETGKAFLTGQIADTSQTPMGAAEIKLIRDGDVAAQTAANAYGEFTLEFTNDVPLWILVEAPERTPIAVRVPDALAV